MTTIRSIEDWNELLNQIDTADDNLLFDIALFHDDGYEVGGEIIVHQNQAEAFKICEKIAAKGHIDAMIRLAGYYCEGKVCNKDIDLAITLYNKGIELGKGYAASNLGRVYRDFGDYSRAFELYQLAQTLNGSGSIDVAFAIIMVLEHQWTKGKRLKFLKE